jgi:dihydrodipicolinate synthase/N-acetylneuraminate lyase
MKPTVEFKTIFAVPTPFQRSLDVCLSALRDHLQALHLAGVTSILANGTTGEFPSMTLAERKTVLECCRAHFPGEVMNNIGTCCVSDSLELLWHAHEFADAVIILPPFYFAPVSSDGLKDFFLAVLSKAKIASYLYNFPKYTKCTLEPKSLQALAKEIGSIKGIKDSDPNLKSTIALKTLNPSLQVFSGNDDSLIEVYTAKLDGLVAGGFSPFPEVLCNIRRAIIAGQAEKAQALQQLVERWREFRRRASLGSIASAKLGISARIPSYPYHVRPPLLAASHHLAPDAAGAVNSMLEDLDRILSS